MNALPPPPAADWNSDALVLDAYLARIGFEGQATADFETLRRLHRAHVDAVSWEIVDLAVGHRISLDLPSLQKKIVDSGRGGCCLENNLLFAAALDQVGFKSTRHLARVRRGSDAIRYRSHAVVIVEAEGRRYLADVGFGDEGPLEPIPFEDGAEVTVGDWTWKLDREGEGESEEWVLRCLHHDGWFDVYSLREEQHHWIDFEVSNVYTSTNPASPFIGKLVAQRGDDTVRHTLRHRTLFADYADGFKHQRELTTDEAITHLRDTFRITLSHEDERVLRESVLVH
ncbi:arylamine N-acetyltransferase family protein [Streptomyces sp. NBC_01244]|uniref:arylamine N-acetyltransferase family protein n=1 Tax=Streptomyces sp. NBC_01244 TaxID=2903797 RepID=UPI002E0F7B33|nr:arylamine N-acetyltransferase [Streptomyces sp. NBC_01244]